MQVSIAYGLKRVVMINIRVTHWAAIISILLLGSGCSVHAHQIPPNAALVKQIGLPVYPNATPIKGQEFTNSSKLGDANQLQVMFATHDDISRVQDFYAKRVPKDARKIVVPLGFTTTTAYQWYVKNVQKQVMFEKSQRDDDHRIANHDAELLRVIAKRYS